MTERSEEDVCCALYECDNDMDRAVIFLLEQLPVGAFATTSKKKKNKTKDENAGETEWNNENAAPNSSDARDKGRRDNRQGGGGAIANGRGDGKGRPRDKKRDDRNGPSDFKVDTFRSSGIDRDKGKLSKSNVAGRGGDGGGRGGRGGGGGGRPSQGRSNYRDQNRSRNVDHQEIDSWDASQGIITEKQKEVPIDTWGDWDNEEYKTLADSKVFSTSSNMTAAAALNQPELAAPPGLEQQILNVPGGQTIDSYSSAISASTNATGTGQSQYSDLHSGTSAAAQLRQALELPQMQSTTLSAEQSQYFNTLSAQNSGPQYNSTYPAGQYNVVSDHAAQRSRRSRVPPPSKIPASAVEMPGDNLSTMGYLDVQFGGLDFGTDDSFDAVNDKYRDATLDTSQTLNAADVVEYQGQSNKATQGSTLSGSGLQATQLLANADSISVHNDSISSRSVNNGTATGNAAFSLNKPESYISQSNTVGGAGYQAGTFPSNAKITSYQQAVHNSYGSSSYPNAQVCFYECFYY